MTRGVALIAVGNAGYLRWAINMAASLKCYSPNVKIQLLLSKELEAMSNEVSFFDIKTVVPTEAYTGPNGEMFPAKLKTNFYQYLAFDETIYLDVDGMMFKDITPLFDMLCQSEGIRGLAAEVQSVYDVTQGNHFNDLKWAKPDVIYKHYDLNESHKLPAINSSFLYIRKGELCEKIFKQAHENLMQNPIPVEQHWHKWGRQRASKISQPDEIYFDVAFAQLGIVPQHVRPIYFRLINDGGPYIEQKELFDNYYGLGLFGDLRTCHMSVREYYDKMMAKVWQKFGVQYFNKSQALGKSKFAVQ